MNGYKITDQNALHFITPTVVGWIDVFSRKVYKDIVIESLKYCCENKGLILYAYVIMTNHIHLIISAVDGNLSDIIRDFKKFTSKEVIKEIEVSNESRKVWMLNKFSFEADRTKRGAKYKFWQDGFHPIILDNTQVATHFPIESVVGQPLFSFFLICFLKKFLLLVNMFFG